MRLTVCSSCFKGPTKEDYVLPCAHYEMGALAWTEAINAGTEPDSADLSGAREDAEGTEVEGERKVDGEDKLNGESKAEVPNREGSKQEGDPHDDYRKKKIEECQASLDRAAGWESFVLDARCGMRVQTGVETLRWYRGRMGWA